MPTTKEAIRDRDEARLAELGYKQELRRHFTMAETFGLALSLMTLVPGIASVLFSSIPNGGPVSMVWGWLVAGFFITFVSLSIAELGSAAPTVGGLYYWTHKFASPRCRNFLAWIVGYFNTIYLIAGAAGTTWAIAVQIAACAYIGSGKVLTTGEIFGIYTALFVAQAIIACLATRALARLQNLNILANALLVLGLIISLAVATPKAFRNTGKFVFTDFENFNGWPNGFAFCLSFLTPLWVVAGFDTAVHISEEAKNASTAIPFAIILSTTLSVAFGFAVNIALAFFMGSDLVAVLSDPSGQPLATIFLNSFGRNGALAMFALILSLLFLTGANVIIVGSRQTFAFARDGALPGSSLIYRINQISGTPINAVWYVTTISWLLGFLAFAGPQAINAVFSMAIGAQYVAFTIPIVSRFVFENEFKPGPFSLGRFGLPVAVVSVLWMIFMFILFLFPATPDGVTRTTMNYTVVVLGGWFIISLVWYYFPRYGGVNWFRGPISNIEDSSENSKVGVLVGKQEGSIGSDSVEEKEKENS